MSDLIFRIKARRESAFLDHDANLARLLADCIEEIGSLKSKLEKAKKALILADSIMIKNSVYLDDLIEFNKSLDGFE